MRKVITGEKINSAGELEFINCWQHEDKVLCRMSYSFLFKIPKNKFDQCSRVFKETGRKFITSITHEKWEDDHVHNFTFAETEEMVKENIGGIVVVGNELLLLLLLIYTTTTTTMTTTVLLLIIPLLLPLPLFSN